MMRFFIGLIAIILLAACAIQDQRVVIAEQNQHPAIALFLKYETAVAKADSFNDVIDDRMQVQLAGGALTVDSAVGNQRTVL